MVIDLYNNGKTEIKAENNVFGDSWIGILKSLVIVYKPKKSYDVITKFC